jgi:hypothetical protein
MNLVVEKPWIHELASGVSTRLGLYDAAHVLSNGGYLSNILFFDDAGRVAESCGETPASSATRRGSMNGGLGVSADHEVPGLCGRAGTASEGSLPGQRLQLPLVRRRLGGPWRELTAPGAAAPNTNAYVVRFIQTLQVECLDHFLVFGENPSPSPADAPAADRCRMPDRRSTGWALRRPGLRRGLLPQA